MRLGEASLDGRCYDCQLDPTRSERTHLLDQLVEHFRLSDLELAVDDGSVVNTQNRINVLHRLCANIGELLDLGSRILDLVIGKLEVELLDSALDSVPTGKTVAESCQLRSQLNGSKTYPIDT